MTATYSFFREKARLPFHILSASLACLLLKPAIRHSRAVFPFARHITYQCNFIETFPDPTKTWPHLTFHTLAVTNYKWFPATIKAYIVCLAKNS